MDAHDTSPRYRLSQRLALGLLPPLAALLLRFWAWTWRVREQIPEGINPRRPREPFVYAFWHEGVVSVMPHWRDTPIVGMASQSFDGALIAALMGHLGFPPPARGSSSRGGAGALKSHVDALAQGLPVVITVDGPRGPRYQSKPGVAQVAALSGRSIVPVSCAARPVFRLKNWDQTLLAPPFARVVFVMGEPFLVAPGQEKEALQRLDQALMAGLDQAAACLDGPKSPSV